MEFIFSFRFGENKVQFAVEAWTVKSGVSPHHKRKNNIKNYLSGIHYLRNFEVIYGSSNVYNIREVLSSSRG
jgi:hypothetical protein